MKKLLIASSLLLLSATAAQAEINVGIDFLAPEPAYAAPVPVYETPYPAYAVRHPAYYPHNGRAAHHRDYDWEYWNHRGEQPPHAEQHPAPPPHPGNGQGYGHR